MSAFAPLTPDNVAFWQGRYESAQTPWDLAMASPPLVRAAKSLLGGILPEPPAAVAVVGAGRGHDAAAFAQAGYSVTAMDFSPGAVAECTRLYGDVVSVQQVDILDTSAVPEATFDMVVEHTCFCALYPKTRNQYVATVAKMLKPGGMLLGLFFTGIPIEEGGPPYGTPYGDLIEAFSPPLTLVTAQGCLDSVPSRMGIETLAVFKRPA